MLLLALPAVVPQATATQTASASAAATLIDPDCEPDRAREADPSLVQEPDEVCPPDYISPPDRQPAPEVGADRPPAPHPAAAPAPAGPAAPRKPQQQDEAKDSPSTAPRRAPAGAGGDERQGTRGEKKARRKQRKGRRGSGRARGERRADAQRKRRRARARGDSPAARRKRSTAPASAPTTGAVPHALLGGSSLTAVPVFLLPIYHAAAREYGVRWEVLAAINDVETGYGRNLGVSSAGAVGWMQFMPATWRAYGVDASGDGRKDPYNPRDAIFAAARYLAASGYGQDERRAIFAYNHADWYVNMVLARAAQIAGGGSGAFAPAPDPLPPARRLDRDFAIALKRIADRAGTSWALMLALLRARGHDDAVPASRSELRALARRLVSLGVRRSPRRAIRRLAAGRLLTDGGELPRLGRRESFSERVVALTHFNRAVGLSGLVHGLRALEPRLARRVLSNRRLEIYPGGRADIERGVTEVRVLVLLSYLASRHREVSVTSLTSGHSVLTASGNVSAHSHGRAVDIAALNGTPILGHQQPGGITERALRSVLLLPAELQPSELISLFALGGPSFALADHADHIHLGY